jgi:hypothetical protein
MLGTLDFVGSSIFLLRILPIKIVSTPAKTNLVPANNTCVHVSLDGILNNAYPNLIQGDALPQRNVHTSARAHTNPVFGVLLSAWWLGEGSRELGINALIALVLVCIGICIVNVKGKKAE